MQAQRKEAEGHSPQPLLSIFHFNDVYDVESKKGKGGAVNFQVFLRQIRAQHSPSLTLFSGDAFSPSILSRVHQGWQMVAALNTFHVDAACFGNHEFDFDEKHTVNLARSCIFPWLSGNIRFKSDDSLLGNGPTHIIKTICRNRSSEQTEKRPQNKTQNMSEGPSEKPTKVGIFGVAGEDWISLMDSRYQNQLSCENVVEYSSKMAEMLRFEQNCDIVIALTHMRNGADIELAEKSSEIDLILGGHDHVIMNRNINKINVVKSGCNFHHLGIIQIYSHQQSHQENGENLPNDSSQKVESNSLQLIQSQSEHRQLTVGKRVTVLTDIVPVPMCSPQQRNQKLNAYIEKITAEYQTFDKVIGFADCPLETRFSKIRTQESNYGNFIADLFRLYHDSDLAVLNSGSVRNDSVLPEGPFLYSKAMDIIDDQIVVKRLPGSAIKRALEFSVSGLPHSYMGSFLFVSGIRFTYSLTASPRIQEAFLTPKEFQRAPTLTPTLTPLQDSKEYTVTMPSYLANGADGYEFLKMYPKIVDEVNGISIVNLILKFFEALDVKQSLHATLKFQQSQSCSKVDRIKHLRTGFARADENDPNSPETPRFEPILDGRIKQVS